MQTNRKMPQWVPYAGIVMFAFAITPYALHAGFNDYPWWLRFPISAATGGLVWHVSKAVWRINNGGTR